MYDRVLLNVKYGDDPSGGECVLYCVALHPGRTQAPDNLLTHSPFTHTHIHAHTGRSRP